jgi:hypothetical protein
VDNPWNILLLLLVLTFWVPIVGGLAAHAVAVGWVRGCFFGLQSLVGKDLSCLNSKKEKANGDEEG